MSGGHTPGPWRVRDDGDETYFTVEAGSGVPLFCTEDKLPVERDRANAILAAAAPDLLAACLLMVPANVCLTNSNVRDDMVVPLECTMGELRAIRAAIAKATLPAQGQPS